MHTLVRYRSASVEFCTLTLVLECDTVIVHCFSWRQTPCCRQDHEAVGQRCYNTRKEKINRTLRRTKKWSNFTTLNPHRLQHFNTLSTYIIQYMYLYFVHYFLHYFLLTYVYAQRAHALLIKLLHTKSAK